MYELKSCIKFPKGQKLIRKRITADGSVFHDPVIVITFRTKKVKVLYLYDDEPFWVDKNTLFIRKRRNKK